MYYNIEQNATLELLISLLVFTEAISALKIEIKHLFAQLMKSVI